LTRETSLKKGIVIAGIARQRERTSTHDNVGVDDDGSALIPDSYPGGGL